MQTKLSTDKLQKKTKQLNPSKKKQVSPQKNYDTNYKMATRFIAPETH